MVTRRQAGFVGAGVLAIVGVGVVATLPGPSLAQSGGTPATYLGSTTIRGNLTVEIALDPQTGAAQGQWAGPIKRVDEVTLLDQWAILRKREPASTGTLIVPREKIVYINVVE
jgi:hypothetical protein